VEYRAAIDRFARERGRPTLLRLMLAYSPPAQEAMNDLYYPVAQNGRVSRRLEESLLVAASDARVCRYCVGEHSFFLVNEFGYDQDAVQQMRSGGRHDGWTDAETALVQTVGATTSDPRSVTPEDIAALCHLWVPKTYATRRYSWIAHPARSRRRTRKESRSVTSSGSGRSGAAWFRARCGRCVL
jgi:hypothetical protein